MQSWWKACNDTHNACLARSRGTRLLRTGARTVRMPCMFGPWMAMLIERMFKLTASSRAQTRKLTSQSWGAWAWALDIVWMKDVRWVRWRLLRTKKRHDTWDLCDHATCSMHYMRLSLVTRSWLQVFNRTSSCWTWFECVNTIWSRSPHVRSDDHQTTLSQSLSIF